MFRRILTSSSMNSNHCCTFISRITNNVGPVHITIAEFEIGDFTLKNYHMLSVITTLVEFKNEKSPVILDLCLSKLGQRNHTIIVFEKIRFFFVLAKTDEKPAFSKSSILKGVFEKLRFRDGSV